MKKYYNYTANGADERGNTNCRCFKKQWGDQATLTVYSKIIIFNAMIGSNSYTICTMHVKNNNIILFLTCIVRQVHLSPVPQSVGKIIIIFPTDWGERYQPLHHEQHWGLQKLYFTMNSFNSNNTDNVWHVGKHYIRNHSPYWTQFLFPIFITFTSPKPSHVKKYIFV